MIQQIYYLGCSYAYSVIDGKGESSLIELKVTLDFMNINKVEFPDISKFKKFSIAEDNGGEPDPQLRLQRPWAASVGEGRGREGSFL